MVLLEYIKDIYRDALGPRNLDPEEILETQNPANEFITGILSSSKHATKTDNKSAFTEDEIILDRLDEEDIEASPDIEPVSSTLLNPVLNPQKLPVSIGISFSVESEETPELDLCVTWGKYFKNEEDNKPNENKEERKKWERKSFYHVQENIKLEKNEKEFEIPEKEIVIDGKKYKSNELRLKIEKRLNGKNKYFISVYLINETEVPREYEDRINPPTEYLIFQPQIRVKIKQGKLSGSYSGALETGIDEEEKLYEFPYIESNTLFPAKGSMCAAIWKEIDPLQENPDKFDFMWVDGKTLKNKDKEKYEKFLKCDLRTEFLPVIPQGIPDFDIEGINFDPEILSEIKPDEVDNYFNIFLNKYKNWILQKKEKITHTSDPSLAAKIIKKHEIVYDRIEKGINLLKENKEILLCFNFANKVISVVQKDWGGKKDFKWRPFQLAFFLMTMESIANPGSPDRDYIDILWVPTGGGKTESYLAISVFLLAYRRRNKKDTGYGTAIISRYTLRLLTVQQFTRTLKTILACEYLRILTNRSGNKGWLPKWAEEKIEDNYVWEKYRFSAGLWVGGAITPNKLHTITGSGGKKFYGALDLLKKNYTIYQLTDSNNPRDKWEINRLKNAQNVALISRCPVCGEYLSVPEEGISNEDKEIELNFIVRLHCLSGVNINNDILEPLKTRVAENEKYDFEPLEIKKVDIKDKIYSIKIYILTKELKPADVIEIWEDLKSNINTLGCNVELLSLSPDKLGYFPWGKTSSTYIDFTILCPNIDCPLNNHDYEWYEYVPSRDGFISIFDTSEFKEFSWMKNFIPVPAYFVDEQIYSKLPSIIISTVDKFARLPFEPATASIFGNINFYSSLYGFFRENAIYSARRDLENINRHSMPVVKPEPPELVIQDELHLIEGPLGSLVGLYETIIEELCKENSEGKKLKYIASTATIKHAGYQTDALFLREAFQFPPVGLNIKDNFFSRIETPSLDNILSNEDVPGKIYIGVMSPGKGPLTPQVRLYARLWMTDQSIQGNNPVVGYYNAVRELAGGRRILEQDISERLTKDLGFKGKLPEKTDILELSSRMDSDEISLLIEQLEKEKINPHFIITTSVFGTGVDIPHLRFMIMNGQPKTTSTYIQATGRVGRKNTALVITFYRSTRPRDISHYEFFAGYHLALYRYVEEVSVFPFSKGAVYRGNGPVIVGIMRNSRNMKVDWISNESPIQMKNWDHSPEIQSDFTRAANILQERNKRQKAEILKINSFELESIIKDRYQGLDKWKRLARNNNTLLFTEYFKIKNPVVLGDLEHEKKSEDFVVYRRVPNSLRNIEDTVDIEIYWH